jgi:hypothetical protein
MILRKWCFCKSFFKFLVSTFQLFQMESCRNHFSIPPAFTKIHDGRLTDQSKFRKLKRLGAKTGKSYVVWNCQAEFVYWIQLVSVNEKEILLSNPCSFGEWISIICCWNSWNSFIVVSKYKNRAGSDISCSTSGT